MPSTKKGIHGGGWWAGGHPTTMPRDSNTSNKEVANVKNITYDLIS